ncbi:MAG: SMI1/KNR4 family protein [Chloroflexota bacterium]
MPIYDWKSWLERWNRDLLGHLDMEEYFEYVQPEEDMTPEVVASGWLGYPSASEAEIERIETRLGVRLPPSYRQFLQVSNGFRQPLQLVHRIFATSEVEWFRVNHQPRIDSWLNSEYVTSGRAPADSFERYLPDALEISATEIAGSAVFLLNPRVVNADGEWEAFYYASWIPGVERCESFWALMQREYENNLYFHQLDAASDDDGDEDDDSR